jgi:mRNA-degrading endonuclease toxin of MazEF toxin-antitoxin module
MIERGDVYLVDLNPTEGREQAGRRYVLVVSSADFNRLGTPVVVPITQGGGFARSAGFAVPLTGTGGNTQGVVLCHQPRAMDLERRRAKRIEQVPDYIVDEVLMKLQAIFE